MVAPGGCPFRRELEFHRSNRFLISFRSGCHSPTPPQPVEGATVLGSRPFRNFSRELDHLIVDQSVRGQDGVTAQLVWLPLEIGDSAPGLLHHDYAGSRVPRFKAELPEAVKTAAGHAGQIESG